MLQKKFVSASDFLSKKNFSTDDCDFFSFRNKKRCNHSRSENAAK